jgi:L-asparaginase
MDDSVLVLITGGTIDDFEYDDENSAPARKTSTIPDLIRRSGVQGSVTTEVLMLKDSQFVTDTDRATILAALNASAATKVIITHGTKTMPDTAKFLGPSVSGKTVVLTGCMVLPSNDDSADALAHITFAFDQVRLLPAGVYVAMQGKIFNWNNVRKNHAKGMFETER